MHQKKRKQNKQYGIFEVFARAFWLRLQQNVPELRHSCSGAHSEIVETIAYVITRIHRFGLVTYSFQLDMYHHRLISLQNFLKNLSQTNRTNHLHHYQKRKSSGGNKKNGFHFRLFHPQILDLGLLDRSAQQVNVEIASFDYPRPQCRPGIVVRLAKV